LLHFTKIKSTIFGVQKNMNMKPIIELLNKQIVRLSTRSFFNPPATEDEIRQFEKVMDVSLPKSMRMFYLNCNGGFFADICWDERELNNPEHFNGICLKSNCFLSLSQILKSSRGNIDFSAALILNKARLAGRKIIPILHSTHHDWLVWNAEDSSASPILYATQEYFPQEWDQMYNSFDDLLKDYIQHQGNIRKEFG